MQIKRSMMLWERRNLKVIIAASCILIASLQGAGAQARRPKGIAMGVDVSVVLIDMRLYREKIVPAYEAFTKDGKTNLLVELLEQALAMPAPPPDLPFLTRDVLLEEISILNGQTLYSTRAERGRPGLKTSPDDLKVFVNENVGPDLVELVCIPRHLGVRPTQDMSRSQLVSYLYIQSGWIEDIFTMAKEVSGGSLNPGIGESTQLFSLEEAERFQKELSKIEPPSDPKLRAEFDNLVKVVETARKNPDLRIALAIA